MHMRSKWGVSILIAGMVGGSGCEEKPVPPPPVLQEGGDWTDTGRYAACNVFSVQGRACGDRETLEVSSCDAASLTQVPADGIYTLVYRTDSQVPGIGADAFRVSADGRLDSFHGVPPTERRIGPREFFLTSTRTLSPTVTVRDTLVGCRAEGTRLYGCYASCRNGRYTSFGTFLAERWTRRAGEEEASGLRLTSESFVEQGMPVDIYVTQGHAYVVSVPNGPEKGGLTVFDVSNPAAPVLRSTLSLPTDNYWNGVWAKGNALYVASADSGVVVFDISEPATPRLVRQVPSEQGALDVHTVFVEGERLYAMSPSPRARTLVFDIRQPQEPVLLGEYVEPPAVGLPPGYPHDALALEGRLYINHWSQGYLIVDVSDPAAPRKLGGFVYPYATSHANAVGRFGERLIAFEGGENWGTHLRVLDVTDPTHPVQVGEYSLGANVSPHNMVLKGSRLYVAHYQHGVRVLDVSVPESPREVAYFNTFRETDPERGTSFYDGAIGMRVPGDGFVYVIDTSRGLLIFPEP
ncbi:putative lipoprotein [Cystobacter fuscus DSM 2262]|uniref:Lipoprotein n=1 Tax=Cystobacter fuscus (strain ATCC 25194 / DSM 2262 / NBRC 100088 / M29) TaxID=1242864 RepID=S9QEJ5_CYSF2|nr:lipoprotein [Cystobacter fuscus]EPX59739.1 putative lipoprotein [Cystobacter fuscus DSM 2262]